MLDEQTVMDRLKQAQLQLANNWAEVLEHLNDSLREVLDSQKQPETDDDLLCRDCRKAPRYRDELCKECDEWYQDNFGDEYPEDDDDWDDDDDLDDEPFDTNDISGKAPPPAPKFRVGDTVRCTSGCGEGKVTAVHGSDVVWYEIEDPVFGHHEDTLELVRRGFKVGDYARTRATKSLVRIVGIDDDGRYTVRYPSLEEQTFSEFILLPTEDKPQGVFKVGDRVVMDEKWRPYVTPSGRATVTEVLYDPIGDTIRYGIKYDEGDFDFWWDYDGGYSKDSNTARAFMRLEVDEVPF